MTPRRRAALRKAQLASARKRRKKNTVRSSVKRAVSQRASYAKASVQTRTGSPYTRHVKGRGRIAYGAAKYQAVHRGRAAKRKGSRTRKVMKYAAVGLGAAGAAYAGTHSVEVTRFNNPTSRRGPKTLQHNRFDDKSRLFQYSSRKSDYYATTKRRKMKYTTPSQYTRAERRGMGVNW